MEHPSAPAEALGTLAAGGAQFAVRRARRDDVPAIVALLADDPLGRGRENASPEAYLAARLRALPRGLQLALDS